MLYNNFIAKRHQDYLQKPFKNFSRNGKLPNYSLGDTTKKSYLNQRQIKPNYNHLQVLFLKQSISFSLFKYTYSAICLKY